MKIVILGGLGYVGSALCEQLAGATEHEVLVIDRRFVPERIAAMPEHFSFIQADMADLDLMEHVCRDADVLHFLAAEVEAESSADRSDSVWQTNFELPRSVMERCPADMRILFPSSGNVFGGIDPAGKFLDLTEEDEPAPKLPYAESKREIERYLLGSGRNFVVLRFGTNYGWSPGIRFNLVTNIFTRKIILNEALSIHGDGSNYRPTVCVADGARALLALSHDDRATGEIFHVVRDSYRIRDLAATVIEALGSKSELRFIDRVVPFSPYGLSSAKLLGLGFEFKWDLASGVQEVARRLRALQPTDLPDPVPAGTSAPC